MFTFWCKFRGMKTVDEYQEAVISIMIYIVSQSVCRTFQIGSSIIIYQSLFLILHWIIIYSQMQHEDCFHSMQILQNAVILIRKILFTDQFVEYLVSSAG